MYKIHAVTGTRAEYGLLRPVLKKLVAHGDFDLAVLVTGTHLLPEYGDTVSEVRADGFAIGLELDILTPEVPPGRAGTAHRTALALAGFTAFWEKPDNRPDAIVLLGDRYEIFAAGQAAALLDIPIAHISGGDVTLGADDEWFRHCLSKMAKLHFPSCEAYRQRLIRMGEEPSRVFNVGGLGDENIRSLMLFSRETLAAGLGIALPPRYALVTFHPETASGVSAETQADILLEGLAEHPDLFFLFTAANADAGGEVINQKVAEFCAGRANAEIVASLGTLRYLSAMKHAAVVVGNSSSGVVETPTLGVPCVDIGDRQKGRITGENVLHAALTPSTIAEAITTAMSEPFTANARTAKNPYHGGDTSGKIVNTLADFLMQDALRAPKPFYDALCENVE